MFIEPWLILIAIMTFVSGIVRGDTDGKIWLKAFVLNLVLLIYLIISSRDYWAVSIGVTLTVIPSICGIALRRHLKRQ